MPQSRWSRLALVTSLPALVAACGGGGGPSGDVPEDGAALDAASDAPLGDASLGDATGGDATGGADAGLGADAPSGPDAGPGPDGGGGLDAGHEEDAGGGRDAASCELPDGGTLPAFPGGTRLASLASTCTTEVWCPDGVYGLVVADFNGDGKDDVAYLYRGDAEVLLSTGHGTFGAPLATPVTTVPESAYGMTTGDFDGDGRPDLLVETVTSRDPRNVNECTASALTLLRGKGDGSFTVGATVADPVKCTTLGTAVADFNGDGRSDVALAGGSYRNIQDLAFGPAQVAIMASTGKSLVEKLDRTDYSSYFVANHAASGDFNGDGIQDLAIETFGGISVSLGLGSGAFASATQLTAPIDESYDTALSQNLVVADLNGDGFSDLVSSASDAVHVRLGSASSLGAPTRFWIGASHVDAVADFDNDGHLDILAGLGPMTILLGRGDGTFKATSLEIPTHRSYPAGVAVGDFDGDGRPDLVASGSDGSDHIGLELFMNTGCSGDGAPACGACGGTCTPDGCLETLARLGGSYTTLNIPVVADADNVYWADSGGVFQVPKDGGARTTLSTASANGGLAVAGGTVYFTAGERVLSVPVGGGAVTTLASGQQGSGGVAVDTENVYWTVGTQSISGVVSGSIMRVPLGGGTPTTFAANQPWPASLAVVNDEVYWINTGCYDNPRGGVVMLGTSGGTPTTLVSTDETCTGGATELAFDATSLYATTYDSPIFRIPLGGGAVTTLAAPSKSGGVVAVGGGKAYYATDTLGSGGTLWSVPVAGGAPAKLGVQTERPGFYGGLAADATSIYWTSDPGAVLVKLTPN